MCYSKSLLWPLPEPKQQVKVNLDQPSVQARKADQASLTLVRSTGKCRPKKRHY